MPKKLPYFPFYPGDWLKDPALTMCSAATRGIWIDLIARMHEHDRSGELRGTAEQLARAARCQTVELVHAAKELKETGTAEVEFRNDAYVIRNRRMFAEAQARKANADRQKTYRSAHSNGAKTTVPEYESESDFELFWQAFPSGRKKSKATAREAFAKAAAKCEPSRIIAAATDYADSEEGRGQFVKMPSTWLNQECWNDDRAAWCGKDKPVDGKPQVRQLTAEQFNEYYRQGKFSGKPNRHATQENWWFGTLKDGSKVECRDVKKRTNNEAHAM